MPLVWPILYEQFVRLLVAYLVRSLVQYHHDQERSKLWLNYWWVSKHEKVAILRVCDYRSSMGTWKMSSSLSTLLSFWPSILTWFCSWILPVTKFLCHFSSTRESRATGSSPGGYRLWFERRWLEAKESKSRPRIILWNSSTSLRYDAAGLRRQSKDNLRWMVNQFFFVSFSRTRTVTIPITD